MNKRDFVLPLTENEKIVIRPYGPYLASDLYCCDRVRVFICKGTTYTLIAIPSIPFYHDWLSDFCRLLINALAQELILPQYMTNNIGYYYNHSLKQWRNEQPVDVANLARFKLCFHENTVTFMYNKNNTILLEVVPRYIWGIKKRIKNILPFNIFLSRYKPQQVISISSDAAYACLQQVIQLINTIQANSDKLTQERDMRQGRKVQPVPVQIPPIIWQVYGCLKSDISQDHKAVFIRAGFPEYASWWENLTDSQRNYLIISR